MMTKYSPVLIISLLTFWDALTISNGQLVFPWEVDGRCLRRRRVLRRRLGDLSTLPLHHQGNGTDDAILAFDDEYNNKDEDLEEEYESSMAMPSLEESLNYTVDDEKEFTTTTNLRGRFEGGKDFFHNNSNNTSNHRDLQGGQTFALRLYWVRGVCWQEEWRERKWCLECVGGSCNHNDILELRECQTSKPSQRFQWLSDGGNTGRLKTASKDLCLQQTGSDFFKLRECSGSSTQILQRSSMGSVFELYPKGNKGKCLNQHHHPKPSEELITTPCSLARKYHTSRWQIISPGSADTRWSGGGRDEERRGYGDRRGDSLYLVNPECSRDQPCDKCEGDCDRDSDCQGRLQCFHRSGRESVPGCRGNGVSEKDYCIDPDDYRRDRENYYDDYRRAPTLHTGECRRDRPCDICEGDCDSDRDCYGNLQCFQRNDYQRVPGCSGRGAIGRDYCVAPKDYY